MPSDSLKAKPIGGVTQTLRILGGSFNSLSLKLMMYAACVSAQTADILRLLLQQQIVLAEKKKSRALKLFRAPKKQKNIVLPL